VMRGWGRTFLLAATAAMGVGCVWASGEAPPRSSAERAEETVRFAVGLAGGGPANRAIGDALAREYAKATPRVGLELSESPGAVATLRDLQDGTTDFGVTLADVGYLAFIGQLEDSPERLDGLRGVAVLDMAPIHLLVRPDAGIHQVTDLRGRSVGIGPPGSGTQIGAGLVLRAYGVGQDTIRAEPLPFQTAIARLGDGQLQAMFFTVSDPATWIVEATASGARLLPLVGGPVDSLLQKYGFLQLAQIRGGLYPRHPESIRTIGVPKVLLCRRGLSDEAVYQFTRRLFAVLPLIAPSLGGVRFSALEYAPATPVPLHPGAARFYRERELFP
jgi:TRAP transporter TAXI family solute receptor